jgi:hypothetical protein
MAPGEELTLAAAVGQSSAGYGECWGQSRSMRVVACPVSRDRFARGKSGGTGKVWWASGGTVAACATALRLQAHASRQAQHTNKGPAMIHYLGCGENDVDEGR